MITIFSAFILLSSAVLAKKLALKAFSPLLFVGLRALPAGIMIIAMNIKKFKNYTWRQIKSDMPSLILVSILTALLPAFLKAYAIKYMPASKAVLLSSTGPFVTAFYAYILFSETISLQKIFGILVGMLGTFALLTSTTPLEEALKTWSIFSLPELAGLAAVFASRYGWLKIQKIVRTKKYQPIEINGIIMTISGLAALSLAVFMGKVQIHNVRNLSAPIFALLYAIIGGNILGYTFYTKALKKHSATFVSLCSFSVPILVSIGAFFLFREPITTNLIFSGCLIFAGIVIFHTKNLTQ
ncbi:DMT family transporter [Candidatus Dependentiae bacterium]